jgi:hypothetical protein
MARYHQDRQKIRYKPRHDAGKNGNEEPREAQRHRVDLKVVAQTPAHARDYAVASAAVEPFGHIKSIAFLLYCRAETAVLL